MDFSGHFFSNQRNYQGEKDENAHVKKDLHDFKKELSDIY